MKTELSPREDEIMKLVAADRSSKQIEQDLEMAEGTLKSHIESIFRKYGVHSRAAAVAKWLGEQRPAE